MISKLNFGILIIYPWRLKVFHKKFLSILLILFLITPILYGENVKDKTNSEKLKDYQSDKPDCLIVTELSVDTKKIDSTQQSFKFEKVIDFKTFAKDNKNIELKTKPCEVNPPKENTPAKFYPLSDHERDKIERVMMASCGDFEYQMAKANAQVILDRVKSGKFGKTIDEVLDAPQQFEKPSSNTPNSKIKKAVVAVFDNGERVTDTKLYYYVNPHYSFVKRNDWVKGKTYVMTVGKGNFIHEYWTEA